MEQTGRKITKIEKQRSNEKRYNIYIDDEFAFGMSGVDVLYYKLIDGMILSVQQEEFLLDTVLFEKARDKAMRFLAYGQRTQQEVVNRLLKEDFPQRVIDKVIELLKKYNYVDDYKFAQIYVENRIRLHGFGKRRIEQELRNKGISSDIINEILSGMESDEVELALTHLEKKTKGEREFGEKEKRRYFDYLQRRGFSYEVIKAAFKIYIDTEPV